MTIVAVQGGRLNHDAAASYNRMRAAGMPAGITSSYRSRAEQTRLRALYLAGKGNYALPPGSSKHETGYSLDLPEPARGWAVAHAAAYGWRRTNKSEAWHFDYFPSEDQHRGGTRNANVSAATQRAVRADADGYWGDDTDMRVNLVRSALNGHYPGASGQGGTQGVADAQWTVGAATDGIWGPKSQAALIETVKKLQAAWGTTPDGIWGNGTEQAYNAARTANFKTW